MFDEDDDADFNIAPQQSGNKLASLFKSSIETNATTSDALKYKAPKQPQTAQPQPSTGAGAGSSAGSSPVLFHSTVQAFKYLNNKYESQGKLGLAVMNNQGQYRVLLYLANKQPVGSARITGEFKLSVQKNNYAMFYDETKQLWSILFDTEDLIVAFTTQVVLCKCNSLQGNVDGYKLHQDLKVNDGDSSLVVEANDSVEVSTIVSLVKDQKLVEIENNSQKPIKLRLGKNKLPQSVEESIVNMKQGDRKLLVLNGNMLKSFYPNAAGNVVFYELTVLRVKKTSKDERANSSANAEQSQMPPLPQLGSGDSAESSRPRGDSIKDRTKMINDQMNNDAKTDKAKLISRMAKMGMQMLPTGVQSAASTTDVDDDWGASQPDVSNVEAVNYSPQQHVEPAKPDLVNAQIAAAKASLAMQNQQLQQQLALQTQQLNQLQMSANQLAVYKPPNMIYTTSNMETSFQPMIHQQQQQQQPTIVSQAPNTSAEISSLFTKIDLITEKLDQIKTLTSLNNQNLPSMETAILLHNIQRIVKENEQYKKELYDKGNKIEEQNAKITELLTKAQNYVEQSHMYLESKNNSLQTSSEKNQLRLLELEKEKMHLTTELTQLTSQVSELNLEITKLKKDDFEMRQQLTEVSRNTDQHKQNVERLLVENADLQTKHDTVMAELKKERQLRKSNETKLQLNEEEMAELRASLANGQKINDERRKKIELDRAQFDREMEELKRSHADELEALKDKLNRLRTNANDSQAEKLKQIEDDLNREWQAKLEKTQEQIEQKYERRLAGVEAEKTDLKQQLAQSNELVKTYRADLSKHQTELAKMAENVNDLNVIKDKYERLQSQALLMKERYESRIKELLDAEPDAEVIGEEIKKLMNLMYKKLKAQIKPELFYSGNGILTAMLKIIKMITLQVLNPEQSNDEEVDYFSQHIYVAPPPPVIVSVQQEPIKSELNELPRQVVNTSSSQPAQISTNNTSTVVAESVGVDQLDSRQNDEKIDETPKVEETIASEEKSEKSSSAPDKYEHESEHEPEPEPKKKEPVESEQDRVEENQQPTEINAEPKIEASSNQLFDPSDDYENIVAVDEEQLKSQTENTPNAERDVSTNKTSENWYRNLDGIDNTPSFTKELSETEEENSLFNDQDRTANVDDQSTANIDDQTTVNVDDQLTANVDDQSTVNVDDQSTVNVDDQWTTEVQAETPVKEDSKSSSDFKESPPTPPSDTPEEPVKKTIVPSKGLFDDDEDDSDQDDLFSTVNKLKTGNSANGNSTSKEENNNTNNVKEKENSTTTTTTTTAQSLKLKMSPPPLFDDDDDDKDIDWFK